CRAVRAPRGHARQRAGLGRPGGSCGVARCGPRARLPARLRAQRQHRAGALHRRVRWDRVAAASLSCTITSAMSYDGAGVGGGLAGAAVARALASAGVRVVVFEREAAFKDRVRGDMVYPWGAAELQRLGLYDAVLAHVGREIRTWTSSISPLPPSVRDFPS